MSDVTLAELCIFACSEAFRGNGEIVATGVGPVPRLAASLAKLTHTPELMMTDGEAYLVEQPVPLGPRGYDDRKAAGYLPFSRFFDAAVWSGRRHAMVTPTQIDRFGQINLSQLGGTHRQPKTQMLGVRGFPGNTIYHPNSFFFPSHTRACSSAATSIWFRAWATTRPSGCRAGTIRRSTCAGSSPTCASWTSAGRTTRCASSRCTRALLSLRYRKRPGSS
jgi:acyl CoA:acetate/3-ketoacid CoA transferase beta subunit